MSRSSVAGVAHHLLACCMPLGRRFILFRCGMRRSRVASMRECALSWHYDVWHGSRSTGRRPIHS
eukprot:9299795-Alexandrium_andersonii.AAC.1